MAEIAAKAENPPLLSVHILLPESIDRRLERWTTKMPGASWPAWGGHITLVPNFVPRGSVDVVRTVLASVCMEEKPLVVRFAAPVAVPDTTRPDYFAVFLNVEMANKTSDKRVDKPADKTPDTGPDTGPDRTADKEVDKTPVTEGQDKISRLHVLRSKLLLALEPLRQDVRPQLVEQPFLPHVTLALGLSESEATKLVHAMRAEPVTAEFKVEAIWLMLQRVDHGTRVERYPIPLGRLASAELPRAPQ
jgi:2'-5' RNA ligase